MPFPPERAAKAKRPRAGIPFDKTQVSMLIEREQGNVSRVADALGTSRGSMRQYIDRHEDLKEQLKHTRERQLDELEQSCFNRAIETSDTSLQVFLLKTQGKSRGYDMKEEQNSAKDIAAAAFDFILSKSKEQKTS